MTEAFFTLALFWFLAAATPGPNFFAVMQMAAGRGRSAALACAYGTVLGTAIWAVAGFFGLRALFTALPLAADAIRIAGALYLIWVGVTLWRASSADPQARPIPAGQAFAFGLATNLANPKTAAFAASLFAVALPMEADPSASLAAILLVCTISASWYTLVAWIGSTGPLTRAYAHARRPVMQATGLLFAGFGGKLLIY
ncbi:MAG: LysE family transporter [Pseudomonadota bacterium]